METKTQTHMAVEFRLTTGERDALWMMLDQLARLINSRVVFYSPNIVEQKIAGLSALEKLRASIAENAEPFDGDNINEDDYCDHEGHILYGAKTCRCAKCGNVGTHCDGLIAWSALYLSPAALDSMRDARREIDADANILSACRAARELISQMWGSWPGTMSISAKRVDDALAKVVNGGAR